MLLLFAAGFAALSWEVLWQLEATLALGLSAQGTALTLATTMAGFSLGALVLGKRVPSHHPRPLRLYARLEAVIGVSGCLMLPAFALVERADTALYGVAPALAPFLHLVGLALVLGPPTVAMGATVPVLALVSRRYGEPLSRLYGVNTLGAALGCLAMAFLLIPALGVYGCVAAVAAVNFTVATLAWRWPSGGALEEEVQGGSGSPFTPGQEAVLTLATGFATFALEVAWFRSLRAAFQSNTESFALMLACVLLALGVAAALAPRLKHPPTGLLAGAGVLVLAATPLVERFDLVPWPTAYFPQIAARFALTALVLGTPIALLGLPLPWLLDAQTRPEDCARCYVLNTLGAVAGSLGAAWLLLPSLGFAHTAWLTGCLLVLAAAGVARKPLWLVAGAAALALAAGTQSGVGRLRIQGIATPPQAILSFREGPDSTISTVQYPAERMLVIDGFVASSVHKVLTHYMPMMGSVPMALHEKPEDALVICFGTGQTANAVRQEGAERLRIVELNAGVLAMGELFDANQGVLKDPRVHPTVMDGRAWLRRTRERYDVITLEPMPPAFAGVNSLYSREFYQLARARLKPGGIVAQWLPWHLVSTFDGASIARTFQETFPNSVLWIDPVGFTGILVGRADDTPFEWKGLARARRSLTDEEMRRSLVLDPAGLKRYATLGEVITDANQQLAYGASRRLARSSRDTHHASLAIVVWAASDPPPQKFNSDELIGRLKVTPR